jgi:hypothetical protein
MTQVPVAVDGIWLRREGDYAVVLVQRDGQWREIIREHVDGPFSHICEPNGVRARETSTYIVEDAPQKSIGWGRGMFIAGAASGITPKRHTQ